MANETRSQSLQIRGLILIGLALALCAGCANLNSIGRHTDSPGGKNKFRAVHLDAQQRLVIFAAERYCAEPSPDALAAYASAIGVSSAGLPNDGIAGALSNGSVAASIGLRTQSITLMRDALYRMCEAAAGGHIGERQVAAFLTKSQDLTAVILAIEQLTGAVAVNPVAVGGSANASSSATLLANAQALEQSKKIESDAKTRMDEAKQDLDAKAKTATDEEGKWKGIKQAAENEPAGSSERAELEAQAAKQEAVYNAAERAREQAEALFKQHEASYQTAKKTREAIEAQNDSAILQATSGVSTQMQIAGISRRDNLSDAAATALATSVEKIVKHMLDKTYAVETCLLYLTDPSNQAQIQRAEQTIQYNISVRQPGRVWSNKPLTTAEREIQSNDKPEVLEAKKVLNKHEAMTQTCVDIIKPQGGKKENGQSAPGQQSATGGAATESDQKPPATAGEGEEEPKNR
ncbi:MAG: hypothetical protein E6Q88_08925 [Lysobacteraceae bacterium]|nr:MAG: hypothetical protein E6Q88_08925 [Xanthomonadaceae bacterium]